MTLHSFMGNTYAYNSALIGFRGGLYGTSSDNGAYNLGSIFAVDSHTGALTTRYSFTGKGDGASPSTALIKVGGVFYGTTASGSGNDGGTLFSFDPRTGRLTTRASFNFATTGSLPSGLTSVSGILYGNTFDGGGGSAGTLFAFDPATDTLTTLHTFVYEDGAYPIAEVVAQGGTLFGTASGGGDKGQGAVFSFALSSGTFTTLHRFAGGADGASPISGLVAFDGALFGSTSARVKETVSTIFKIVPATGAKTVLHTFTKAEVLSTMIPVGDALFGTSAYGPYRYGSIFRFDPATQKYQTLYDFTGGPDGGSPKAALIKINNHLFGTTGSISTGNPGTVFRFDR